MNTKMVKSSPGPKGLYRSLLYVIMVEASTDCCLNVLKYIFKYRHNTGKELQQPYMR